MVETGRTNRRYVTLETAGRDEVVVETQQGVDLLSRHQKPWQWVVERLGTQLSQAYLVQEDHAEPSIVFKNRVRKAVDLVKASIRLSNTHLMLDSSGAYRVEQRYMMDNAMEQYLVVELPEGAKLWTAYVAGDPVKPSPLPGAKSDRSVRIPLVKTAAGDLDYEVVLKYGGKIAAPGTLSKVRFPLMRTVNIDVEQSLVRLRLPKDHRWGVFGGNAGQIDHEASFLEGKLNYQRQQIERIARVLQTGSLFEVSRCETSLRTIQQELTSGEVAQQLAQTTTENQGLASANGVMLESAQGEIRRKLEGQVAKQATGNRDRLDTLWQAQTLQLADNVVNETGDNFQSKSQPTPRRSSHRDKFNKGWLSENKLNKSSVQMRQQTYSQKGKEGKKRQRGSSLEVQSLGTRVIISGRPNQPESLRPQLNYRNAASAQVPALKLPQSKPISDRENGDGALTPQGENEWSLETIDTEDISKVLLGEISGKDSKPSDQLKSEATAQALGLASLDIAIPNRGQEYLFLTERGEVEITAHAMSRGAEQRSTGLVWIAIAAGVLLVGYRSVQRGRLDWFRTNKGRLLLAVAGGVMLVAGFLPLYGLVGITLGIVLRQPKN